MPKSIVHPTDSRLLERSRQHMIKFARDNGLSLRQNCNREAPRLATQVGSYAHAKQHKRIRGAIMRLRTRWWAVFNAMCSDNWAICPSMHRSKYASCCSAGPIRTQKTKDKNKLYALRASEVECISKGKARNLSEFAVKVTVATNLKEGLIVGMLSMPGNPYDGRTLRPRTVMVGKDYEGADVEGVQVLRSGQRRGITRTMKATIKRRSAIEPTSRHMESDDRNPLKGALGDGLHEVLCAAGHNINLLQLFAACWRAVVLAALIQPNAPQLSFSVAIAGRSNCSGRTDYFATET